MGESAKGPRSSRSVTLAAHDADRRFTMLARLTATKQLVLPDKLLPSCPGVDCFSASVEDRRIVLVPLHPARAGPVREKLAELGISEQDVTDAVAWHGTATDGPRELHGVGWSRRIFGGLGQGRLAPPGALTARSAAAALSRPALTGSYDDPRLGSGNIVPQPREHLLDTCPFTPRMAPFPLRLLEIHLLLSLPFQLANSLVDPINNVKDVRS